MKTTALFSALLLALASTASSSAYAATADGKPLASETQAAKKMKPHSHVEEKMGISLAVKTAAQNDQAAPQKRDKSKHFHPTDGK